MRRAPALLLPVLLLGGCLAAVDRPDDYAGDPHHDMDGDGNVDNDDAPLIVEAIVNRSAYDANSFVNGDGYLVDADASGDINGDGRLDLGDLAGRAADFLDNEGNGAGLGVPVDEREGHPH